MSQVDAAELHPIECLIKAGAGPCEDSLAQLLKADAGCRGRAQSHQARQVSHKSIIAALKSRQQSM